MGTSYYSPQPLPYRATSQLTGVNPIGFDNSGDPRKATRNQRALVQGQGDLLQAQDQQLGNEYRQQSEGTQAYLQPVENTLAQGGGGYNPTESAAINLSGQDKQNIITGAGISAGAGTASAVGAAERAAAAAGGNPAALATYRARAAQTQGAQGADALTQARIGAKQQEATGATNTGQARLGQQAQGLNYYQGLQGQQNQNAQNEAGLQHGAYGTQTSGTNAATGQVLSASQTPSTFDKAIGLASGAAKAFLDEGTSGYLQDGGGGMDAVVGENGPEAIVEAASDPVRSHTNFMDDGGMAAPPAAPSPVDISHGVMPNGRRYYGGDAPDSGSKDSGGFLANDKFSILPWLTDILGIGAHGKQDNSGDGSSPGSPFPDWRQNTGIASAGVAAMPPHSYMADGDAGSGEAPEYDALPPGTRDYSSGEGNVPFWNRMGNNLQSYLAKSRQQGQQNQQQGQPQWNKATPYQQLGETAGTIASLLDDGAVAPAAPPAQPWYARAADAVGTAYNNAQIRGRENYMRGQGEAEMRDRAAAGEPHAAHFNISGRADAEHNEMQKAAEDAMRMRRGNRPPQEPYRPPQEPYMPHLNLKPFRPETPLAIPYVKPFQPETPYPIPYEQPDEQPEMMLGTGADRTEVPNMADGGMSPKIITSPTRVHLDHGDAVVPLSYRPKAKVRPSVAMAAMGPRVRQAYGARA